MNYRFGFNGKEKDNEVKGEGNSYNYGARIYDPRIGRWASVDRYFSKFPNNSSYIYCNDNPITLIDNNGDSTLYYSWDGELLFAMANKKFEPVICVIPDYNVVGFKSLVKNLHCSPTDEEIEGNLRFYGYNYDLKELRKFYKSNYKFPYNGPYFRPADGKGPLYCEYSAKCDLIMGYIRISKNKEDQSPGSTPTDCYLYKGFVSIHNHYSENRKFDVFHYDVDVKKWIWSPNGNTADPNEQDVLHSKQVDGTGILDICVTDKNIRLYNNIGVKISTSNESFKQNVKDKSPH